MLVVLSVLVVALTSGFIIIRLTNSNQQGAEFSGIPAEIELASTVSVNQEDTPEPSQKNETAVPAEMPAIEPAPTRNSIRPKPIVSGERGQQAFWTPTPPPTATPSPTPTPYPTFVSLLDKYSLLRPPGLSLNERWIDVDLTNQKLVAYEGHLPVFESLVSTGLARYPTVTGQFRIWLRFTDQDMNGRRLGYDYYLKNVPYVQYFYQDYALHGTFWHNNFGRPMSHGCVNLPTPAAEWLFNWAEHGTVVNVHH